MPDLSTTTPEIQYFLAQDTIDRGDIEALIEWLRGGPRLTKASLTPQFEEEWSRWVGQPYSVFVNSGSSANLLAYFTLLHSGRLRNLKVVVPSVGWVTTVAPAMQFGFTPIMCEADPETFGLDLNHLESILKREDPGCVALVQVLGVPHKMDEIRALQQHFGFYLIEDACAAVGATYHGRKAGAFGDLSTFSYYFGHQISTIEGGMVSTSDRELYEMMLRLRSHGWGKDLPAASHQTLIDRYQVDNFHAPFVFYEPGFNLRSSDLNAFLGLRQMTKIDWITQRRRENHDLFRARLQETFYLQQPPPDSTAASISCGVLAQDVSQRRRVVAALVENGIETRIFSAGNLGLHPFWANRYGAASFPMADRIHYTGFFLPNNPSLSPEDVARICDIAVSPL